MAPGSAALCCVCGWSCLRALSSQVLVLRDPEQSQAMEMSPAPASEVGVPERGVSAFLRQGQAGARQRESADCFHQPLSPRANKQASRSCQNKSLFLRPELLDNHMSLFLRRMGCVSVCSLCSTLGVAVCQELSPRLLQPRRTQDHKPPIPHVQSQAIKGCLLGGSCKTQDARCKNQRTRHT